MQSLKTTRNMKSLRNDTICAVSTPPGVGGIAVIRVSGPDAALVAGRLWKGKSLTSMPSHTVRFGMLVDPGRGGEVLDEAVATMFRAPASFTGEDVVELSVHGSRYIQRRLLQLLQSEGCRLAEPGEFTRRAFANGKMDLAQAEAVADIIASNSRASHRLAASQLRGGFSKRLGELRDKLLELSSLLELELDFSEEDVEFASRQRLREIAEEIHAEVTRLHGSFAAGNAIKEGIPVAIVGPTNAGKSSLLNLLAGEDRAIVSDIHGTTRDTVEDTIEIGDYLFRFIDTAGLRDTSDPVENLGIERSLRAMSRAAIIIHVHDITQPLTTGELHQTDQNHTEGNHPSAPVILLLNKADIAPVPSDNIIPDGKGGAPVAVIPFSTKTGQGQQQLKSILTTLADQLRGNADEDTILVTNLRHAEALRAASATTAAILDGLRANLPGDLIAQDLRATIHHLSAITGSLTTPDILASIFSRFCIGK